MGASELFQGGVHGRGYRPMSVRTHLAEVNRHAEIFAFHQGAGHALQTLPQGRFGSVHRRAERLAHTMA